MATGNNDLALSGLVSGLDWKTLVQQLSTAERSPQLQLKRRQGLLNARAAAFGDIKTQLAALQTQLALLKGASLYDSRASQVSDPTLATATAGSGAALGSFTFDITQLASAARLNGASNIGQPISSDGDMNAVTVGTAGFSAPITAGTFTVNGKQVTIATTDSLQQVFDKIAAATGNNVTASYSTATDRITLTGSSEIVLGSATDTSNFLQVTRLYNNGTGSITSNAALGGVRINAAIADSDLATPITDGGGGAGQFLVNGVAIIYNASTDSINNILARINNSSAGVNASYDSINDRFVLANKATGDIGVAIEDVTGNFAAATGLASGTLAHGQNLIYTVNGGDPIISQSNTISQDTSGVTGVSVTALKTGSVTVSVTSDSTKIKAAVQSFIDSYNTVQSLIAKQTANTTDSKGVVTAGVLASDRDASDIAAMLRRLAYSPISGVSGTLDHLADLGIDTNGKDNTIALKDSAKLDAALSGNMNDLKSLFSDAVNGLAVTLDKYVEKTIGNDGTLVSHQTNLTKQSADIDKQIERMERVVQANADRLTAQFISMERAQAYINQQLQYLAQRFG